MDGWKTFSGIILGAYDGLFFRGKLLVLGEGVAPEKDENIHIPSHT